MRRKKYEELEMEENEEKKKDKRYDDDDDDGISSGVRLNKTQGSGLKLARISARLSALSPIHPPTHSYKLNSHGNLQKLR
ncbi:hypothetical protein PoB_005168300 [Plakobranchus ocellatus]|uniref:Uncharacterized protein n=1 Tax=Plakobranchus ocellatus TaxID=259542 RepID=A0AAV4BZX2_9GAST|nr:hypothetical protein PoB_005168300 [Plakobranchus ocellatus]